MQCSAKSLDEPLLRQIPQETSDVYSAKNAKHVFSSATLPPSKL
ncbi:UNVERIFIED_ORG: hypothetical protein J2Y77_002109 [Pseudomonas lini]